MAYTLVGGIQIGPISITLIDAPPNYGIIVAIPPLITIAGGIHLGFPLAGLPAGSPPPSIPGGAGLPVLPVLRSILGSLPTGPDQGLSHSPQPTGAGGITLLDLGGTHITLPLTRHI